MAENSAIEWTDHTFNPWVGCTKVSPGCDHCYAEARMDTRLHVVGWGAGKPRVRTSTQNWRGPRGPLAWNRKHDEFYAAHGRRQRVFCASLADVFDNEVSDEWRIDLATLITMTPNLDWLLLTKRIGNAARMLAAMFPAGMPPNVWLGATVVNQEEADRDVPKLLATPARVRFLSMEPLLGPVDLGQAGGVRIEIGNLDPVGRIINEREAFPDGDPDGSIDWIIVGGESGRGARPMHPAWARSLRDQCAAAGVPFLFKQWGDWIGAGQQYPGSESGKFAPIREFGYDEENRHRLHRIGKKAAGRLLDGLTHDGVPA